MKKNLFHRKVLASKVLSSQAPKQLKEAPAVKTKFCATAHIHTYFGKNKRMAQKLRIKLKPLKEFNILFGKLNLDHEQLI